MMVRQKSRFPGHALFATGRAARLLPFALALLVLVAGHGWTQGMATSSQAGVPAKYEERLPGFLGANGLPDGFALLSPPPAKGSAAFAADVAAYEADKVFRGTARWNLASKDSDLALPEAPNAFSCALGIPITK
jgi:acid phosphatase (class A)